MNNLNLNISDEEYAAGVAITCLDRHHMLTLWREAYLQSLAQQPTLDDELQMEAIASAAADRAVEGMAQFIETLDEATDEDEMDEPPVMPAPVGRPA